MNQAINEQLELGLGKSLFKFVFQKTCQVQALSLNSIIKQTKLKYNVFMNKLINMRAQLNYM